MSQRIIKAKTSKVPDRLVEVNVDFHEESLDTMCEWAGDDAVKSSCIADWVVAYQSTIRSAIEKGKTNEEIQQIVSSMKPGVKTFLGSADPVESVLKKFNAMDPEEQAEFQRALLARLKAAKTA